MNTGTHRVHSPLDSWKQISVEMRRREKKICRWENQEWRFFPSCWYLYHVCGSENVVDYFEIQWSGGRNFLHSTLLAYPWLALCSGMAKPMLTWGSPLPNGVVTAPRLQWPQATWLLAGDGLLWSAPFLSYFSHLLPISTVYCTFLVGGGGGSDPLPLLSHSLPSFRQELKVYIFFLPNH